MVLLLIVPLGFLLIKRMEGQLPAMTLKLPSTSLGKSQTLNLQVSDSKSGIRKVRVGLLKDGQEIELFDKTFPAAGVLSGGLVREETLQIPFDPDTKGIKDGKAILRMATRDYSWRHWGKGNVIYQEQEVTIDTKPPAIELLSRTHYLAQGGSGLAIYKLSEDCPVSGVTVGETFYPGYAGGSGDKAIHMAFFAVDYRQGPDTPIYVNATDAAGNQSRAGISHLINPRNFKHDTIAISDGFLDWKMPEFNAQMASTAGESNLDLFLKVNGEMRRANYEKLKQLTDQSDPEIYWKGEFMRLPGAANKAGFADHRTYTYKGKKIDEQTHMGDRPGFPGAIPRAGRQCGQNSFCRCPGHLRQHRPDRSWHGVVQYVFAFELHQCYPRADGRKGGYQSAKPVVPAWRAATTCTSAC